MSHAPKPRKSEPPVAANKMTIEELERLLNSDEDVELEILPNGEVRQKGGGGTTAKPLTMKERLGGEYAAPKP